MNLYGKLAKFTFSFQNRLLEFDFAAEWWAGKMLKSNLKNTDKERYQKICSVFPTKSNSLIPNLGVRGHDIYCINIFAKLSSPYW